MAKEIKCFEVEPFTMKYWPEIYHPKVSVKQKTIKYLELENKL